MQIHARHLLAAREAPVFAQLVEEIQAVGEPA
jgi:hypothetical protein